MRKIKKERQRKDLPRTRESDSRKIIDLTIILVLENGEYCGDHVI